jgi:hypothetical protein
VNASHCDGGTGLEVALPRSEITNGRSGQSTA